jgi:hypothetical protein
VANREKPENVYKLLFEPVRFDDGLALFYARNFLEGP